MSASASMPMSTESSQQIAANIGNNLLRLIEEKGITQRQLAEQLGVSPATMNDYCRGKRVPQATLLFELVKQYGVDLNVFLTSEITTRVSARTAAADSVSSALRADCRKYCGVYYMYYFDTSKFKGRDTLVPAMSLLYGVLCIYEDPSPLSSQYHCAAILGIPDHEEAKGLVRSFRKVSSPFPGAASTSFPIKKTTHGDASYFLLADEMENLYRLFIRTEDEYDRYLYGNIIDNPSFSVELVNELEPRDTFTPKIKVFCRDGAAMMIDRGSTVLDFAFHIHTDLGLHFKHAWLNESRTCLPAYTRLNEGDQVEIVEDENVMPSLAWFRYIRTSRAADRLVHYFEQLYADENGRAFT